MRKSHGATDTRKTRLSAARAWTVTICGTKCNMTKGVSAAGAWKVTLRGTSVVRERVSQQPGRGNLPFCRPGVVRSEGLSSLGVESHAS